MHLKPESRQQSIWDLIFKLETLPDNYCEEVNYLYIVYLKNVNKQYFQNIHREATAKKMKGRAYCHVFIRLIAINLFACRQRAKDSIIICIHIDRLLYTFNIL
jgi:hypothetical protein